MDIEPLDLPELVRIAEKGAVSENRIHCWGAYALNCETGDVEVYLAFSAESTPVNTCQVHMHLYDKRKIHVESISCVNYQKKIGFQEDINSTVYR